MRNTNPIFSFIFLQTSTFTSNYFGIFSDLFIIFFIYLVIFSIFSILIIFRLLLSTYEYQVLFNSLFVFRYIFLVNFRLFFVNFLHSFPLNGTTQWGDCRGSVQLPYNAHQYSLNLRKEKLLLDRQTSHFSLAHQISNFLWGILRVWQFLLLLPSGDACMLYVFSLVLRVLRRWSETLKEADILYKRGGGQNSKAEALNSTWTLRGWRAKPVDVMKLVLRSRNK